MAFVTTSPTRLGPNDVQVVQATADPITLCAEAITPEIEKLLLNADWAATERRLPLDDDEVTSPLVRFLLGHAALTGNRGNDALVLFWSCLDPLDLSAWDRWTTDLLRRFPDKSVAHYLRGDALARLERWAPAVEAFTRAIDADPSDSAIAFNARGVARIGLKELEAAADDFDRAIELDPKFLDAFASLGRYWLLKKAGQSAFECYARAVDADPNSLIGINGRACAQFGLGDWDAAVQGFRVLLDGRPDFAVEYNLAVVVEARCALALAAAGGEAAMGIERRYDLAELGRATWDARWGIANARELGLTNSWVLPMRIDAWGTGWAVPGFARGAARVRITMGIDPGADLKSWTSSPVYPPLSLNTADYYVQRLGLDVRTRPAQGMQIRQAYLDTGDWPANPFGLFYPAVAPPSPTSRPTLQRRTHEYGAMVGGLIIWGIVVYTAALVSVAAVYYWFVRAFR